MAKCEEASAALFGEEIAGLSEEMLLAVTEDAPTTTVARSELLDDGLTLVDLLERTGLAKSKKEARRTIDSGGAYVNNVRQTDAGRTLGPADLLHDRYVVLRKGSTRCPHRPGHMRRRFLVASLVLLIGSAVALTSCAGADQRGSPAHRMSVWVSGTGFGEQIGTLIADNARVAKDVPNGTGAVHAACGTILNDAEMANAELPSPDPEVTDLLTDAYGLEGTAAQRVLQRRCHERRSC